MQRLLEPHEVIVPFASRVAEHFPDDRVEARRAFPHLLSLIQASALLHQYQRERDIAGRIIADCNDYHLCRHLMLGPLSRQLGGGLSDPARRFQRLRPNAINQTFSTTTIRTFDRSNERSIRGWLTELKDAGLAVMLETQRGRIPATWQLREALSTRTASCYRLLKCSSQID